MDEREWVQFQWPYLVALLGGRDRVERLAYETGAFVRKRSFERPSDVLQLLMTWAVAERSLMETAFLAAEAEMADVSDVALMSASLGRSHGWERCSVSIWSSGVARWKGPFVFVFSMPRA